MTSKDIGAEHLRMGRFMEAAQALADAVAQDPNDEGAWRLFGGALASKGDYEGAVAAFERTVLLNPELPKNHYNLALALQGRGDIDTARRHLQQALALDPNYTQAAERLRELAPSPGVYTPGAYTSSYEYTPPPAYAPPPILGATPPPILGAQTQLPPPPPSYTVPRGGYIPPPVLGSNQRQAQYAGPRVDGTSTLILGIISVAGAMFFLPLFLGPVAWIVGNNALAKLDKYPHADQSPRSNIIAGRTLGIVSTVLLIFTLLLIFLLRSVVPRGLSQND